MDIEPQEYLCRAVVTIIPVSQLSQHRPMQATEQQQSAQQVSAFSSPFAQHPYSNTDASDWHGQESSQVSQLPYQDSPDEIVGQGSSQRLSHHNLNRPDQASSLQPSPGPSQQSDQDLSGQFVQDQQQVPNQDTGGLLDQDLLQPLLRSPSQLPPNPPSTSDVRLSVIPENAQANDVADIGPSASQDTERQVTWPYTNPPHESWLSASACQCSCALGSLSHDIFEHTCRKQTMLWIMKTESLLYANKMLWAEQAVMRMLPTHLFPCGRH